VDENSLLPSHPRAELDATADGPGVAALALPNARRAGTNIGGLRPLRAKRAPHPLRVAMLAPPWITVPPPGYGGIEAVVADLCDELVRVGHDVTLFACPGSHSLATVRPLLADAHPDEIGSALYEADHVAAAFAEIDAAAAAGTPFDVVHDHSGFAALAMADRLDTPMLHTLHGPFTPQTTAFYQRHHANASIVAISATQLATGPAALRASARVIPNPIRISAWPLELEHDDYLLWIGRMTEEKGPHRAIDVAARAGRRLVLAGPVQPGQETFFREHVAPHVDDDRVRYVGEVAGVEKQRLFGRAAGMLMPIRWCEPFGMVMIEALAAGTPVLAFPEGAATEIVVSGHNGFLVDDEREMAAAVERLGELDPATCRASVASRFDTAEVTAEYVRAYQAVAGMGLRAGRRPAPGVPDPRRAARPGVPDPFRVAARPATA